MDIHGVFGTYTHHGLKSLLISESFLWPSRLASWTNHAQSHPLEGTIQNFPIQDIAELNGSVVRKPCLYLEQVRLENWSEDMKKTSTIYRTRANHANYVQLPLYLACNWLLPSIPFDFDEIWNIACRVHLGPWKCSILAPLGDNPNNC